MRIAPIRAKSYSPSSADFKYLDGVIYGADYTKNPGLQSAITQFKYKFNKQLTYYFAELMGRRLMELSMVRGKGIVLVPVPLHKKRLNYRGFNQAELIAYATAAKCHGCVDVLTPLMRVKNTSQQAKLTKWERHQNLHDAFDVSDDFELSEDQVCFVVDDVCTTGATLDSCAKALKSAGILRVYGLVVARAFK